MGEVVELGVQTTLDLPPRKIIDAIECDAIEHVVVITIDHQGQVAMNMSSGEIPLNMWLLEIAKKRLLEASDPDEG